MIARQTTPAPPKITQPPASVRKALRLSPFYKKYLDAKGLAIVGSEKVSDAALVEARDIVNSMLWDREDIRKAIIRNKIRVAVMAPTEQTTDIPEHSDLTPKDYWNVRARGLGATTWRPAISCAEENILNLPRDRYPRENILVHEFAHTIHQLGVVPIDPKFDRRLKDAYKAAIAKGLWRNTYAATNHDEYWAEGVQSYFDTNDRNNPSHNDIDTREKLARYDPTLYAMIDKVFHSSSWRYVRYDVRHPRDKPSPDGQVQPST